MASDALLLLASLASLNEKSHLDERECNTQCPLKRAHDGIEASPKRSKVRIAEVGHVPPAASEESSQIVKLSFVNAATTCDDFAVKPPEANANLPANHGRSAPGKPMYQCGYCKTIKTSVSAGADGRVRIRCECGGKRMDGTHRMHANWDPVAWVGAPHAALGNARPMANKNRGAKKARLLAQPPPTQVNLQPPVVPPVMATALSSPEPSPSPCVSGEVEGQAPPFLVLEGLQGLSASISGRDLKKIPCFQPGPHPSVTEGVTLDMKPSAPSPPHSGDDSIGSAKAETSE